MNTILDFPCIDYLALSNRMDEISLHTLQTIHITLVCIILTESHAVG
jgi:hypothetical protein